MNIATDYFHALEGRIRIKIPELKGSPGKSRDIKLHLSECAGINYVQANPTTGNALILYNSREISQNDIITMLREELDCFQEPAAVTGNSKRDGFAGVVARAFMESALQTMVMALI
jgi:hypothetical protein